MLRIAAALAIALAIGAPGAGAQTFERFLEEIRVEALGQGLSPTTVDAALATARYLPEVVDKDVRRKTPGRKLTFHDYMALVVTPQRVADGRRFFAEHATLLGQASLATGVPAEVMVALWGVESDYGRFQGKVPVISALSSLAYAGRRRSFFRGELLAALTILEAGHVQPEAMYGSWAGALGQSQFMPSSFLRLAVDGDGDGRADIWNSLPDVFASIGNYLSRVGWRPGEPWAWQVVLPRGFDYGAAGLKRSPRPAAFWQKRSLTRLDGSAVPAGAPPGSLVLPGGRAAPAYLAFHNFRMFRRWNKSTWFATAVSVLANRVALP